MIVYIDMCTLHTLQRRTADIAWSRCAASPRVGLIFRNRSAFAQSPLQPCIRRTDPLSPTLVRACFSKLDIKHGSPMQVSSLKNCHLYIRLLDGCVERKVQHHSLSHERRQIVLNVLVITSAVVSRQSAGLVQRSVHNQRTHDHHVSSCPPPNSWPMLSKVLCTLR